MEPQGNEAGWISQQRHEATHESLWWKTQNKSELNTGIWNVHSLYTAGALKTLVNRLSVYRVDIIALQEVWWTGSGILGKWDCTLFYSCDNNDHILGTGFLVSKRINHLIIDFEPFTPRICILRIRGKFLNYGIVNGHAPTETSDNEEMDGVFGALERTYDISPRNYIKIAIGDINAQVDKEAVNFHMTGKYSLTNNNGSWLIQFAAMWNMIIGSTFCPH